MVYIFILVRHIRLADKSHVYCTALALTPPIQHCIRATEARSGTRSLIGQLVLGTNSKTVSPSGDETAGSLRLWSVAK